MKHSAESQRFRIQAHTVFFCYRWLAWALAGLALTLPGRAAGALPRDALALLALGGLNVAFTALAQRYVQLARRWPWVLGLDLGLGLLIIWLSAGSALPFFPYALGALILPTLCFGWRGGMVAAAVFVAYDLLGLALLNPLGAEALDSSLLLLRLAVPFLFTISWALIGQLVGEEVEGLGGGGPRDLLAREPFALRAGLIEDRPGAEGPERGFARPVGRLPAAPLKPASLPRGAERPGGMERQVVSDLNPAISLRLQPDLEQLAAGVAQASGVSLRVSCQGDERPLSLAQRGVLLRLAQETLLNVQQHAHASSAVLSLAYEPRAVTLVVQDDGVGLLDGTYERPGLHSLRALRYRLAELDGQLAVFESESGGLTVRATLPLDD